MQGQQSVTVVAEAFRSHVPLIAELAVASISGDVGRSARQVEALKDICACFEQLPKVHRLLACKTAAAAGPITSSGCMRLSIPVETPSKVLSNGQRQPDCV